MEKAHYAIVACVVVLALLLGYFVFFDSMSAPAQAQNGTAQVLECGFAGDAGYAILSHSGSGNLSLSALNEPPKRKIAILSRDYLSTGKYSDLVQMLRSLEKDGFEVSEKEDIMGENNSIVVIASGAMPIGVLEGIGDFSSRNHVVYIGRGDLVYSDRMERQNWTSSIGKSAQRLTLIEKSLAQYMREGNFSLIDEIRENSWAKTNSTIFAYSGNGTSTVLVGAGNSSWLRTVPLHDCAKPQDSAGISGPDGAFPWENPEFYVSMEKSDGVANYTIGRNGQAVQSGELGRAAANETFRIAMNSPQPGIYLINVFDRSGRIGAKALVVHNLSVSLDSAFGNSFSFSASMDGAPLQSDSAEVGLSHSNNSINSTIKGGKFTVRANLPRGKNTFVISLDGGVFPVGYQNDREDLAEFYAKNLGLGAILILAGYAIMRMGRKPTYRIIVPESVPEKNPEFGVSREDVLGAIRDAESRYGWTSTPLLASEIASSLERRTGGLEIEEGNMEAILRELAESKDITCHKGAYGLMEWGDAKENYLRRFVRDMLIHNGVEFSEYGSGFMCGDDMVLYSPENAQNGSITVFESKEDISRHLASLGADARAATAMRLENRALRFVTLRELPELL
jgi:hypothetical protein